jgi:hypothetical protein
MSVRMPSYSSTWAFPAKSWFLRNPNIPSEEPRKRRIGELGPRLPIFICNNWSAEGRAPSKSSTKSPFTFDSPRVS